jgi:hypothetical protein
MTARRRTGIVLAGRDLVVRHPFIDDTHRHRHRSWAVWQSESGSRFACALARA